MTSLDRSAERVLAAYVRLDADHMRTLRHLWDGAEKRQPEGVEICRTIAAAVLEGAGWLPIKDAPDRRPEWGAVVGRWTLDIEDNWVWKEEVWSPSACGYGYYRLQYTHFRLNPAPPPRSK